MEKENEGEKGSFFVLYTLQISIGSCHCQFASALSNIEISAARSYQRSAVSHEAIVRSVCCRGCLCLKQSLGATRLVFYFFRDMTKVH
jgi:hypothetical protein